MFFLLCMVLRMIKAGPSESVMVEAIAMFDEGIFQYLLIHCFFFLCVIIDVHVLVMPWSGEILSLKKL